MPRIQNSLPFADVDFFGGGSGISFCEFQHAPPEELTWKISRFEGFGIGSVYFAIICFPLQERVMLEDFHVHLPGEIVQIRHHQILVETRPSKIHIVIHSLGKGPLTS